VSADRRRQPFWYHRIGLIAGLVSTGLLAGAGSFSASNTQMVSEVVSIGTVQMVTIRSPRVLWLSGLNANHTANVLYRSRDGGHRWTLVKTAVPGSAVATTVVESSLQAMACSFNGASSALWFTRDGGRRWTRRPLPHATALPLNQVLSRAADGTMLYLALSGSAANGEDGGTVYASQGNLRTRWASRGPIPNDGLKTGMGLWAGFVWVTGASNGNGQEVLDRAAWHHNSRLHWSSVSYALPALVTRHRSAFALESFPPIDGWLPVTANQHVFFDQWHKGQWQQARMAPISIMSGTMPIWTAQSSDLWLASGRVLWRYTFIHPHWRRLIPIHTGAIVALSFLTPQVGVMVSQTGGQVTLWRTDDGGTRWHTVYRSTGEFNHPQATSV